MADANKLFPFILKYEGGWAQHLADKGGATNMGITINTWKTCGYDKDRDGDIDTDDLRIINQQDVFSIFKKHYWDRWKADQIQSQDIANILVDWLWLSGSPAIRIPQQILGVKTDGIVGEKTIQALNNMPVPGFFYAIKEERLLFIENIIQRNPSQAVFRAGWINRLNNIRINM